MKKSLNFWTVLPFMLIILGILLLIGRVWIKRKNRSTTPGENEDPQEGEEVEEPDQTSTEGSITNHYKIIRSVLPKDFTDDQAKLITAQAMHETGIFKSRLYLDQNNLFGMRHPIVRETKSTGENNGFATFASPEDSVRDLLLYFNEFGIKPKDFTGQKLVSDYVKLIKSKGYFTDDFLNYFNAVRTHYLRVKELVQ